MGLQVKCELLFLKELVLQMLKVPQLRKK